MLACPVVRRPPREQTSLSGVHVAPRSVVRHTPPSATEAYRVSGSSAGRERPVATRSVESDHVCDVPAAVRASGFTVGSVERFEVHPVDGPTELWVDVVAMDLSASD